MDTQNPTTARRPGGIDDRDRGQLVSVIPRGDGMELRTTLGRDLRGRPVISLRLFRKMVESGFVPIAHGGFTLRYLEARALRAALDSAIVLLEAGEGQTP
jgi:hypothetical protein